MDAQGDAIDETVNEADIAAADFMMQEESFAAFIKNVRPTDFESGEAWYRWTYQVDELDEALLYERVLERCAAAPSTVSVLREDGAWENQTPPDPGRILGLSITERSTGGVAQALQIVGESATILVRTEHSIRYVLCDVWISVIRQDGSAWQLLQPAAQRLFRAGGGSRGRVRDWLYPVWRGLRTWRRTEPERGEGNGGERLRL